MAIEHHDRKVDLPFDLQHGLFLIWYTGASFVFFGAESDEYHG